MRWLDRGQASMPCHEPREAAQHEGREEGREARKSHDGRVGHAVEREAAETNGEGGTGYAPYPRTEDADGLGRLSALPSVPPDREDHQRSYDHARRVWKHVDQVRVGSPHVAEHGHDAKHEAKKQAQRANRSSCEPLHCGFRRSNEAASVAAPHCPHLATPSAANCMRWLDRRMRVQAATGPARVAATAKRLGDDRDLGAGHEDGHPEGACDRGSVRRPREPATSVARGTTAEPAIGGSRHGVRAWVL